MSNEVLVKQGNRAEWSIDSTPIDPKRLPEGYPWKEETYSTVEWDGVGEGFESVVISGHTYYRISELTLTYEELLASNITLSTSKLIITKTGQEWKDLGMPVTDVGKLSQVIINNSELVVARDTTTIFHKTGIYATSPAGSKASYIVSVSWGGTVTHPISSDFLPIATPTAAGVMKQAAAVANVTAAPTAEEFNALLKSLRDAGILATE